MITEKTKMMMTTTTTTDALTKMEIKAEALVASVLALAQELEQVLRL